MRNVKAESILMPSLRGLPAAILLAAAATTFGQSETGKSFGNDAPWFQRNIPTFECADPKIEEIYAYRWNLYKAHIRDVGERGTVITEFLDDVGWQKHPFASLNDATPFHIKEGRWLRDPRPVDEHIDYLYTGGGNDRHFAEAIAEATYANFLARGDLAQATKHLPTMRHIYNLWDDKYDFSKGLYFIEPLLDATEYTISSIDASGGKDGFRGGDSFRPTMNAYQYGNARAISRLAALTGDIATAQEFEDRAQKLKATVQSALWSDKFEHFIDRYQVNNQYVKYWDPIRGRELAGYVPWVYGLPDDSPKFNAAWRHLLSSEEFAGPYGLRTVGPSYEHYMKQYRYLGTSPECQWNGPSWPFQTTQVLDGMANLLNDYHQSVVGKADYLRLLRQYTDQHYLNGKPNLQEDYNPDNGKPIVGLDRSHHYNHSGYVDLIVTGLVGLRPRADNVLEVNPLLPDETSIPYFRLSNLPYHGHDVTVVWDADGTRYRQGKGLSVYVDGKRRIGPRPLGRVETKIGKPRLSKPSPEANTAVNVYRRGYPTPSASIDGENTIWQAVDGRAWFFPEMVRGWSTKGSTASESWFALDYGRPTTVRQVRLQFYEGAEEAAPREVKVQMASGTGWKDVGSPVVPVANGTTTLSLSPVRTERLRIVLRHDRTARLVEVSTF